jgi:hypothetical protein
MSENYEVGYGKPPKNRQFKPGQSGNPRGKPKRAKTPQQALETELNKTVRIREGETVRRVTRLEAIMKRLVAQAASGDHKAMKLVFDQRNKPEPPPPRKKLEDHGTSEGFVWTDEDDRKLEQFIEELKDSDFLESTADDGSKDKPGVGSEAPGPGSKTK